MENISKCLVCSNDKFEDYLICNDYLVTKNDFKLVKCKNCNFIFTNPRPLESDISNYYASSDYISHTNRTANLFEYIYKCVKNYSLKKKYNLIKRYFKKGNILDYGCGTGDFLAYMKSKNWNTFGLEPNDNARNFAIEKNKLNIKKINEISEFENNYFNIITLWHVLEHIYNADEIINLLKNKLDDNGTLIIALPNHESYDAIYYKENWAAYDVPRHIYHFNKNTIKLFLEKHKLKITEIYPMKFDSFYVSILSEKIKNKKNNIFNAFLTGLKSNFKAKSKNNYSSLIYIVKKQNN